MVPPFLVMKRRKLLVTLIFFFVEIMGCAAQVNQEAAPVHNLINYALTHNGVFLCDNNKSVILNFPNVSTENLYTKFVKACWEYEKHPSDGHGLSKFVIEEGGYQQKRFVLTNIMGILYRVTEALDPLTFKTSADRKGCVFFC